MASSREWFETVAEAQRRAKKRLPKSVYYALLAGSEQGLTLSDNVNAFSELGFQPHVADLPRTRDQATTVLGQEISLPVVITPTVVQAVTPHGQIAAALYAGTFELMSLACFGLLEWALHEDGRMEHPVPATARGAVHRPYRRRWSHMESTCRRRRTGPWSSPSASSWRPWVPSATCSS